MKMLEWDFYFTGKVDTSDIQQLAGQFLPSSLLKQADPQSGCLKKKKKNGFGLQKFKEFCEIFSVRNTFMLLQTQFINVFINLLVLPNSKEN